MRYAVTGGNGYIGSQAVRKLLGEGHSLALIVRANSAHPRLQEVLDAFPEANYDLYAYDGSADSLVLALEDADRVVHLAALYKTASDASTVAALVESNVKFSADIFSVLATHNSKAPVVSTSTFSSFDRTGAYAPATVYAATKTAVEVLAPAFGLSVTFLRLGDTYGPNDWRVKVHNLIRDAVAAGESFELRSPGSQPINLTHVEDVLAGFAHAFDLADAQPGEVHYYDFYYPENERTLSALVSLIKQERPGAQVIVPELGSMSPVPPQTSVLPGFTPSYVFEQEFPLALFGDNK